MAEIHIITELESDSGWSFTLRLGTGPHATLHTAKLSWADYEHWTHGSVPPAQVAAALVKLALESLEEQPVPECFDAGRVSRQFSDFPDRLRNALSTS